MFTTVRVLSYIFICKIFITESSPAIMTNCTLLTRRQALVQGQLIPMQALLLLINDLLQLQLLCISVNTYTLAV